MVTLAVLVNETILHPCSEEKFDIVIEAGDFAPFQDFVEEFGRQGGWAFSRMFHGVKSSNMR
jgi:hypothetical protein